MAGGGGVLIPPPPIHPSTGPPERLGVGMGWPQPPGIKLGQAVHLPSFSKDIADDPTHGATTVAAAELLIRAISEVVFACLLPLARPFRDKRPSKNQMCFDEKARGFSDICPEEPLQWVTRRVRPHCLSPRRTFLKSLENSAGRCAGGTYRRPLCALVDSVVTLPIYTTGAGGSG